MGVSQTTDRYGAVRADENAVRLLFIEHSPDYGALVRATLDGAAQGHFEVCNAPRLDLASRELLDRFDAILVDRTASSDEAATEVDELLAASKLASRLPVILLTGNDRDAAPDPSQEAAQVRGEIARSRLPGAILRAVRRYRRLGQNGAAEPIVLRDPMRALAPVFAKLRESLGL